MTFHNWIKYQKFRSKVKIKVQKKIENQQIRMNLKAGVKVRQAKLKTKRKNFLTMNQKLGAFLIDSRKKFLVQKERSKNLSKEMNFKLSSQTYYRCSQKVDQ